MMPPSRARPARGDRVRVHWVILATVIVLVSGTLLVQGYLSHLGGRLDDGAVTSGPSSTVPPALLGGGPVVDARNNAVQTRMPPERTIALTFDDGPDPVWTPQILAVLRQHHVHATFFVVGAQAIEHPDVVRQILADGHEIGIHTLTHVDLGAAPSWRQEVELRGAQAVIAGVSGRKASLLRLPYSATTDSVTDRTWTAVQAAADDGYLTVFSTLDGKDWQRPGVAAIEANLAPRGTSGQVALLHDGGGDRSETVAARHHAHAVRIPGVPGDQRRRVVGGDDDDSRHLAGATGR